MNHYRSEFTQRQLVQQFCLCMISAVVLGVLVGVVLAIAVGGGI